MSNRKLFIYIYKSISLIFKNLFHLYLEILQI